MKKHKIYEADDRMISIIQDNYGILQCLGSFGINLGFGNKTVRELCRNGGGSGWTRGMVNSFLMRNGLPVYASGSGYNPDWEKEGVVATVQNRDSRLGIFTKKPGDVNYYGDDGTPSICQISLIFHSVLAHMS